MALNGTNSALASFTAPGSVTAQQLRFQLLVAYGDDFTAGCSIDINLLPGGLAATIAAMAVSTIAIVVAGPRAAHSPIVCSASSNCCQRCSAVPV